MTHKTDDKMIFRGNKDDVVTLTIGELDDLVYTASMRAANRMNTDLYRGLSNAYFNRWNDDINNILNELEQIKLRLDTGDCNCK